MKKTIYLFWLIVICAVNAQAQLANGYYRVQNTYTDRYISIDDNNPDNYSIKWSTGSAEMSGIRTYKPGQKVTTNPATIVYVKNVSGNQYNIEGQGTSIRKIAGNHTNIHLVPQSNGSYQAYGSYSGTTLYLKDDSNVDKEEASLKPNSKSTKAMNWWAKKVDTNTEYIGIQPDFELNGKYYGTIYASFPFKLVSSGMKAYVVSAVSGDGFELKMISGDIPGNTPVIIECSSNSPSGNIILPIESNAKLSGSNLLTGTFCDRVSSQYMNVTVYDKTCMRVLSKSNGKLAFKKASSSDLTEGAYLKANKAYLLVPTTSPDVLVWNTAPIEISSAKQVAFYSDKNLDFANLPELKAYVATGYDKATGTIWLTRVKQVPAKTGFLLMGDKGTYDIPVAKSAADCYYKNMFKGTLTGKTIQTTDGDYTNYYLSKGDYGVGFYKVTKAEGVKIGANRCYLPILTEIPAVGSEGNTVAIKVSAAKQVPYFTSTSLDFTSMETKGVKAYTATGYNYDTGTIWLSRVKKVPAKTGVLVMANEAGEYDVPTATVVSVYENMFAGSETAQTIYTNETIEGVNYVNYYLSNGDYGVGFYKAKAEGVKMSANRCYLQIPYREKASGARGESADAAPAWSDMVISEEGDDIIAIPVFGSTNGEDDNTTSVQSSMFNAQSSDIYYNLHGQRVDNPGKGLYIKNGRKTVIK